MQGIRGLVRIVAGACASPVMRGSVLLIMDNEIATGHNGRRVCHGGFSTAG
jgi:hypothetical protein